MAGYNEDRCSRCMQITDPLRLYMKRVVFNRKNHRGVVRSRTVMYLCDVCIELDPDWNLDPGESPGNTSAARERIKERHKGGQT